MSRPFFDIALLLLIAALVGALFVRLRQPVLIAYIVVGIAVGPAGLGVVQAHDQIDLLAQIGVTVLLFVVGLKLDLRQVRHIGPVALATGLGQLTFTIAFGFLLVLALGKSVMEAVYISVALTFSSTIIIVKLLSDKRELDTLHGRIAVGFLIVQDIAVVLAMMVMSAIRDPVDAGAGSLSGVLLSLGLRLGAAALLMYLLMRYFIPPLVAAMARSQELLLVFAVAWGVALAALGEWAGFSKEAGAFMAGFSLASTQYREAMSARLTGIRDFLLLFFFVDLGAKLELSMLGVELGAAAVLSLFVLIGNPLIVMAIMGWMGYRKRTGFMAGLTVAQISEFSIIFVAMGITLGHVGVATLGLTTLIGLITITLSTYMILYSQALYERLAPWLGMFERRHPAREQAMEQSFGPGSPVEVVIIGLGRYGGHLMLQLRQAGIGVLGVDFDPETVDELRNSHYTVLFGDGEDPSFLETLPLTHAKWVVSSLHSRDANLALLHALKTVDFPGKVAAVARNGSDKEQLETAGVARVFNPFDDAADYAASSLLAAIRPKEETP